MKYYGNNGMEGYQSHHHKSGRNIMLTHDEDADLTFIFEDLRKEYFELIRTDNADLLEVIVANTHRELQRLIKQIIARKLRF